MSHAALQSIRTAVASSLVGMMTDEEFVRRYEAYEENALVKYLERCGRTGRQLQECIDHLVAERNRLKDSELAELEATSKRLLERLKAIGVEKLLVELECFKDVLALQRAAAKKDQATSEPNERDEG